MGSQVSEERGRDRWEWRPGLTLQLVVLSKAGVIHEVLLGLGPCGLEVDTTHPIQDALQGLDVAAPELLGLFLGSHSVRVRVRKIGRSYSSGPRQRSIQGKQVARAP